MLEAAVTFCKRSEEGGDEGKWKGNKMKCPCKRLMHVNLEWVIKVLAAIEFLMGTISKRYRPIKCSSIDDNCLSGHEHSGAGILALTHPQCRNYARCCHVIASLIQ